MLQRVDAMETELGTLLETLRTGANRLNADLHLLEGNVGEVREAVTPRPRFEPEATAPPPPAPPLAEPAPPVPAAAAPPPPDPAPAEPTPVEPLRAAAPSGLAAPDEDDEGARLIALNMALNGTPRAETQRYLEENFELGSPDALLDEVYASVEG
jgi:hypothetical protein